LSIAYSSSFGGIATIIGTPPNVAYVAFLKKHNNYTFPFADWMKICTPIAIILLGSLFVVLTRLFPPHITTSSSANEMIDDELKEMGKISKPEKRVLFIFILTALAWITKDLINAQQALFKLDDTIIAIAGASLLFMTPANDKERLLDWPDTQKMAWGILLLFGGGISLAHQLEDAGLIQKLGLWISSFATGGFMLILIITLISIFISEVMSNVAQVIVFAPVVAGIAEALKIDGIQLGLAMTLGASCAGMLPMGTPPNAIVFASGKLKLKHMLAAGFIMNMISAILISLFCWYVLPTVLNIVR
jgi:solute carrier family 13 (sodium-dependent dicarboxylate transporter), member 2/3/5